MKCASGELSRDAALHSSIFFIWPEKPRDYLVLLTRLLLITCLVASVSVVLYATFSSPGSFLRPPNPTRNAFAMPLVSDVPTNLSHLLFCIAGSADTWRDRSSYSSLWWTSNGTRGFVWLDEYITNQTDREANSSKELSRHEFQVPVRVSDPSWTRFRYSSSRAAVRIARIIWDSYRLQLPEVRWFVMGDDDTVFFADNLVSVLASYDHRQMWYIGGNSESVEQDAMHSYEMAFGGGGFAVSYPLAQRLVNILDGCLDRYYYFYGSDQKIAACISEIGVPFTKERGFHQLDIRGNAYGVLAAHPLVPLVSLHHLDYLDPIFPNHTQISSLQTLMKAYRVDPNRILQQTLCYDHKRKWSISISWGYTLQIYTSMVAPKDLEVPLQTFKTWRSWSDGPFTFNTRPVNGDPCEQPVVYFPDLVQEVGSRGTRTRYRRVTLPAENCSKMEHIRARAMERVIVSSMKMDPDYWNKPLRRHCCEIMNRGSRKESSMLIRIRNCRSGENIST